MFWMNVDMLWRTLRLGAIFPWIFGGDFSERNVDALKIWLE
jgi:hypothetical protein